MFKKIITISTLLFLSITVLTAQTPLTVEKTGGFARLQAMGNNPYVLDPFNMTLNSAWGAYYSDFIMGDLGSVGTAFGRDGVGQFIGANFKVSSSITVGAFLSRNTFNGQFSILNLDPYGVINNIGGAVALDNNVELMATYSAGKHKFGFGFSYASTTSEQPIGGGTDVSTTSASQLGLNFGYVSQLTGNLLLDVSLSLSFPGATFETANQAETSASETIISLNARTFIRLSQKFNLVPVLQFVSTSASGEAPTTGTESESVDLPSTSVFILGVGFQYSYGNFLFAGGPSYASLSTTTPAVENGPPELSTGFSGFPIWNLGGEWDFADWVVGRIGYTAVGVDVYNESAPNGTDVVKAMNTVHLPAVNGFWLGVGFRASGFSLDATINDDVLRQGFNVFGGVNATFAYISLSVAL